MQRDGTTLLARASLRSLKSALPSSSWFWCCGCGRGGFVSAERASLFAFFRPLRYARKFHNRPAKARGLYWKLVRRYKTELCQECGRPVRLVYHAPDAIWEAVTGRARHPRGEAAPGILCPCCLSALARAKGLPYLRWTCATDDSVMYG